MKKNGISPTWSAALTRYAKALQAANAIVTLKRVRRGKPQAARVAPDALKIGRAILARDNALLALNRELLK
jgi:hypothetical protein